MVYPQGSALPCQSPFFSGGLGGNFLSLPFRGRRPLTALRFPGCSHGTQSGVQTVPFVLIWSICGPQISMPYICKNYLNYFA
jgi:hypothetical protein